MATVTINTYVCDLCGTVHKSPNKVKEVELGITPIGQKGRKPNPFTFDLDEPCVIELKKFLKVAEPKERKKAVKRAAKKAVAKPNKKKVVEDDGGKPKTRKKVNKKDSSARAMLDEKSSEKS